MADQRKEKQALTADPKRQANDALRGYVYQIWHSVNAWLDLADDEILYLEGAEDFDKVSDDTATVTQVKDTQHKITLRSQEVNDAINHYWELQANHPDRKVKFCFLTRSRIGAERGNPFGEGQMGLQVWSRCSGDEAAITKISEFLQNEKKISKEVDNFLKQAELQEIYECLIEPITWEADSKEASYVEESIKEKLVLHGAQDDIPPSYSSKVVDHLLKEALTVATRQENRELTRVRFLEIFETKTTQRVPLQYLQTLQKQAAMADSVRALIGEPSDITIQSQSPILTTIPPLYPDVTPRKDLFASIQAQLQSEGVAVIQGGAGRGKTTLAKLTAGAISGSWLWLNFTNRDSLQIVQLLQRLVIVVSNQSSQVNIVLDDLDLQPQELRLYEEVLSIIIYGVRERGAKLLITSQHRLPNNLIRRLGVPQSVSILVPDFTISEIEQFAQQLGCPPDHANPSAKWIQFHTRGHPRLVHARLAQLRGTDWQQYKNESILQTPPEVIEEREEVRQLLINLPEDQREYLYRLSLLSTAFRKDYALKIGELSKTIPYSGDVFSQLVGPWIDPVNETYYTISPLLNNAANPVWSESKINDLHAQIANAILKAEDLTTIEAHAIFVHSMIGQNKEGMVAIIRALFNAPENHWKRISQEFFWLIHIINPSQGLFLGDAFVNHLFRLLQYRIAVEVEPEAAPNILEIWDKETKPYEPHKSYLLCRLTLAIHALIYFQVPLPVKQRVGYLKEIIDIKDSDKEVQEIYGNFEGNLEEHKTDKANFLSTLFSFILARPPIYAPDLSDLIDALDEMQPPNRALLLADFENYSIYSRILIDRVWMDEEDLGNSDWTRCLQVYEKVIEKTIEWGYLHITEAAARGKAIIYEEYLQDPDAAHKVLQDIVTKVGTSPVIEDAQATVYFHHKHYQEALEIYERILPEWNPPPEKLDLGPSFGCRHAAICAAHLGDWKKAATFFEDGAERAQGIGRDEVYIGLYADAGFAQFKAGNMLDSMKFWILALQEFEMLPQDNTNVKYVTLKKRLAQAICWIANQEKNFPVESIEPPPGSCSDPETNERVLTLPDITMGYSWLHLARIEYKFGLGTTAFQHALHITDRDAYPALKFFLFLLQSQHDFRNKTFDEFPQRMYQLADAHVSMLKHTQNGKEIGEKGFYTVSIAELSNFASVDIIIDMLVAALLVQLSTNRDKNKILAIWRANSSGLPIEQNMIIALDLIESILSKDERNAVTVITTQETKYEERFVAALKIVHNTETDPKNLFYAHTLITTFLIGKTWEEHVVTDLAELLSKQWLKKIKFQAVLEMPRITVPQIEQACNSSETGKKKIGQILLAAHQAVSVHLSPDILQQFRSWIE